MNQKTVMQCILVASLGLIGCGTAPSGISDEENSPPATTSTSNAASTSEATSAPEPPPTAALSDFVNPPPANQRFVDFDPPVSLAVALAWAEDSGFREIYLRTEVESGGPDPREEEVYLFDRVVLFDDSNGEVTRAEIG